MKRTVVLLSFFSVTAALSQPTVAPGSVPEKIAGNFQFVEGPVWKAGIGLLFSDIYPGKIYRWTPDSGATLFLSPSDSSNGLTYDLLGRLLLTQMRLRRLARMNQDRSVTPLVSTFRGKKFNSPNDLVVKSDGSIFFTDPDFNVPSGEKPEIGFKGVYRIDPSGALQVLDSTFDKPNGICFSQDEKILYVNESAQCKIYAWDVDGSTLTNKRLFFSIPASGYADGMKTDPQGNVYCTGPTGVWIITPKGALLGKIATPETPSNCAWGDADGKTLFITARTGLYRVRSKD